jgi:hypothetical protein
MNTFLNAVLGSTVRHAMTIVAGVLVSHAIIPAEMSSNLVVVGTGVIIGAVGYGLSLAKSLKK